MTLSTIIGRLWGGLGNIEAMAHLYYHTVLPRNHRVLKCPRERSEQRSRWEHVKGSRIEGGSDTSEYESRSMNCLPAQRDTVACGSDSVEVNLQASQDVLPCEPCGTTRDTVFYLYSSFVRCYTTTLPSHRHMKSTTSAVGKAWRNDEET